MKKRQKKVKIQHGIIDKLGSRLEKLSAFEDIKGIVPGEIRQIKGSRSKGFRLEYKYQTNSGYKLLAKGSGTVQEVFITIGSFTNQDELLKKLKKEKIID